MANSNATLKFNFNKMLTMLPAFGWNYINFNE